MFKTEQLFLKINYFDSKIHQSKNGSWPISSGAGQSQDHMNNFSRILWLDPSSIRMETHAGSLFYPLFTLPFSSHPPRRERMSKWFFRKYLVPIKTVKNIENVVFLMLTYTLYSCSSRVSRPYLKYVLKNIC